MKTADVSDYLTGLDAQLCEIGRQMRPVIDAALPDAAGTMWHGHPVWGYGAPGKQPICLLKAYRSHLSFGLWRGQQIIDVSGRLTAGGRQMAPVRLSSTADIDEALFAGWLRQAQALEQR
ncbi:DUF1801 domain-containing protein [Micromonospora sp. NPDC048909]|uniref:DUF1801 domain-containing protein n=1 Tax=Micromonospora sp. NPDC048909 TaxID=3155643 RepID=UPI0033C9CCF4